MDNTEAKSGEDSTFITRRIFTDFMTGIARLETLVAAGAKHLNGFHQSLELLRQPPKSEQSELVLKTVIEANDNERLRSYIESGWAKPCDRARHMGEMNHCFEGLHDCWIKAKQIMIELEDLVGEAAGTVQGVCKRESEMSEDEEEETEMDANEYASFMAVIYGMVKQDCAMQERIVSALNLSTPAEELESYCLMWSLRPFLEDDTVRRAFLYVCVKQ